MAEKVNVQSILLPLRVKELQQEVHRIKEELMAIPSTDLSENEPWYEAKNKLDTYTKLYGQALQANEQFIQQSELSNPDIINYGDLLRIKNVEANQEYILCFQETGDPLIRGILGENSPLGIQCKHKAEGEFTILNATNQVSHYEVEFVKKEDTKTVEEYLEKYNHLTDQIVENLLKEI